MNVNGSGVMTHTGGTMAFASEQLIDLDHHLAMAVLSNIADELSSEAHVRHITAAVLELAGGVKVPKARGPVNPGYAVIDSVVILMSAVLLAVLFLKPRALERTRAAIEITTAIVILVAVPAVFGNSWPVLLKIQPDLTMWGLGMTLLTLAVSSIRTIRILGGNHAATRIA